MAGHDVVDDPQTQKAAHALERTEREERRAEVARLHCQHVPYREIGQRLGVSHQTVANDVNAIRQRWAQRAESDYVQVVAREEFKLDQAERMLWETWGEVGEPSMTDAGVLARSLARLSERRAKLLGLDRPVRTEVTGLEGRPIEVSLEERKPHAYELVDELARRRRAGEPEAPAVGQ